MPQLDKQQIIIKHIKKNMSTANILIILMQKKNKF